MALGKSRTLTFAKCEAVVSEILYASGTPRNGRSDCARLKSDGQRAPRQTAGWPDRRWRFSRGEGAK